MIFVLVTLATFWIWEFLYAYADWLPEYISYFLVPGIAYGLWLLPHVAIACIAVASVVGLLHRITHKFFSNAARQAPTKRASLPPLP